jgi:hypothetical protein
MQHDGGFFVPALRLALPTENIFCADDNPRNLRIVS